ncbi:MAG: cob(I)yrinic acid a,c-diamide adenosyltransferase [Candidatus Peregrinibacteria bacterium]|nr:cob(I)yrinic acid a,c-diamide adenosyltransferase [Candidatus Peregrinibacteria bacterium]
MKITTKTGDKGETSLFGGRRVSKASSFIELVGELDELQALVGWCRVSMKGEDALAMDKIQDDLYRMMSVVGFEFKCPGNIKMIDESDVEFLEKEMGKHEEEMDKVKEFVRPGGSELATRLHIARTVCRRVERGMVEMKEEANEEGKDAAEAILKYLNRLSDFLFVLAYRA